jgi:hypothetical protein
MSNLPWLLYPCPSSYLLRARESNAPRLPLHLLASLTSPPPPAYPAAIVTACPAAARRGPHRGRASHRPKTRPSLSSTPDPVPTMEEEGEHVVGRGSRRWALLYSVSHQETPLEVGLLGATARGLLGAVVLMLPLAALRSSAALLADTRATLLLLPALAHQLLPHPSCCR